MGIEPRPPVYKSENDDNSTIGSTIDVFVCFVSNALLLCIVWSLIVNYGMMDKRLN